MHSVSKLANMAGTKLVSHGLAPAISILPQLVWGSKVR